MFKFLLILILVIYALYRLSVFFGRMTGSDHRRPQDPNVHVNSQPNKDKKGYQGGEYVDYEELK